MGAVVRHGIRAVRDLGFGVKGASKGIEVEAIKVMSFYCFV